jgi:hypothetical protein
MKKPLMICLMLASPLLRAGEADVVDVRVECPNDCTFNVTVRHDDKGWDHYANQWEILTPDRKLIAKRVLYHPHVNEQPFTRSLSGVKIPPGIDRVPAVSPPGGLCVTAGEKGPAQWLATAEATGCNRASSSNR